MALSQYEEIKKQLIDEWGSVSEDRLYEYAEDFTPVYYNAIIEEWGQLPAENCDLWPEYYPDYIGNKTITDLMTADLHIYYLGLVQKAYDEIKEEKE